MSQKKTAPVLLDTYTRLFTFPCFMIEKNPEKVHNTRMTNSFVAWRMLHNKNE